MRKPVGIIGFSSSGKTTLAVALVRYFSERGERVAYVKHTHHVAGSLSEGGDTQRALEAGALLAVAADEDELVCWERGGVRQGPSEYEDPASLVAAIDADRIFVEGWKDLRLWPVILVERAGHETMRPVEGIAAVVSDFEERLPVPRFAPGDLDAIASFVDRIAGP